MAKPRMTRSEYAAHRGCSRMAVWKAERAGRIEAEPDGRYDPAKCDAAWAGNTDPGRRRNAPLVPQPSRVKRQPVRAASAAVPISAFQEARTRREQAQAAEAELRLAVRRGELIEIREVEQGWSELVVATRNALLGVPHKIKMDRPHLAPEDIAAISAQICDALEALAQRADLDDDEEPPHAAATE